MHRFNPANYWHWLRDRRILSMNRRNAQFIALWNPRQHYHIVDQKLLTKDIALKAGVPVPTTYAVVEQWGEVARTIEHVTRTHRTLVIKPNTGSAGRGVLVLEKDAADVWRRANGRPVSTLDMRYHLASILSGLYSLSELPDSALIEQRIFPHDFFGNITWHGTPDLRIILYRTIPVMAMMRLPTRRSDGRANLHQGAVGVGIDIAEGVTVNAVQRSVPVSRHPDTGAPLLGLELPVWQRALDISRTLASHIPLQYIGIDLMLDAAHGFLMIEANVRPGLSIQIANNAGLRTRLDFLSAQFARGASPDEAWHTFLPRLAAHDL